MVPVIYAPEAERDLDAITAYIAKDNPKAAEQSLDTGDGLSLY
jgi:plasmid stabilization system protein ParE